MRDTAMVFNKPASTHRITSTELQRQRRDDFVNRHLHITQHDKKEHLSRVSKKNARTLLSFFSFGVSLGLPFFFTFATVDLDDSGARDPSANVVESTIAVAFVVSSSFAVESVCACA